MQMKLNFFNSSFNILINIDKKNGYFGPVKRSLEVNDNRPNCGRHFSGKWRRISIDLFDAGRRGVTASPRCN